MKSILLILMLVPTLVFSQVDTTSVIPKNEYQVLHEEGTDVLTMGIAFNVTAFGLLFSGPLTDKGVGTLFFSQQLFGITIDVIGVVKLIRAKRIKNKKSP